MDNRIYIPPKLMMMSLVGDQFCQIVCILILKSTSAQSNSVLLAIQSELM